MTNTKLKFIFIPIESAFGLALGISFAYLQNNYGSGGHLNDYYLKLFMSAFLGIIVGIGIPGIIYLALNRKAINIFRALGYSSIGLIAFLILYIIVTSIGFKYIPYNVTAWILPILLPLIGAIIGFNYRIDK